MQNKTYFMLRRATLAALGDASVGSVSCVATFYDQLFVGTEEGVVLHISAVGLAEAAPRPAGTQTLSLPAQKPVLQLLPLGEIGLLLALCNGRVEAIDAHRMRPRSSGKLAVKGEVLGIAHNSDSTPDFAICVVTALKAHLFRWTGDHHEVWKVLNLTGGIPVDVAWSRNKLCIAQEDGQLGLVDLASGVSQPLHGPPGSSSPARSRRRSSVNARSLCFGTRVRPLSSGKFLLVVDSVGIIVNGAGEPSGNTLAWSSPPKLFVCVMDLVVSLHLGGMQLQVQSTDMEGSVREQINLDEPAALLSAPAPWNAPSQGDPAKLDDISCGGGVILLTQNSRRLQRLLTISMEDRLQELFKVGDVDGALNVFQDRVLSKENDATARQRAVAHFHVEAGKAMLRQGKLEMAFQEFLKGKLDPKEVVAHLPPLQSANFTFTSIELESAPAIDSDEAKPYLEEFLLKCDKDSENTANRALIRLWSGRESPQCRKKLEALCEREGNSDVLASDVEFLLEKKEYRAASLLYASRPDTTSKRKALQLWADLGSGKYSETDCDGIEETIHFLSKSLDEEEGRDLLWKFSSWVLRIAPHQGVRIFTTRKSSNLNVEDVIAHLRHYETTGTSDLVLIYLLFLGQDENERGHDVEIAREFVKLLSVNESFRERFMKFLERPVTLRGVSLAKDGKKEAEATLILRELDMIDANGFLHERVHLNAKLSRHGESLNILIGKLKDPRLAEKYCMDYYEEESKQEDSANPFLELVCIYLRPEHAKDLLDESLRILKVHGEKIDPSLVISKLPAEMPLKDIEGYLATMFQAHGRELAKLRIKKGLLSAHNIKTRSFLTKKQQRNFVVTSDTLCRTCKRPIGAQPFQLDPSQSYLTHFPTCGHADD